MLPKMSISGLISLAIVIITRSVVLNGQDVVSTVSIPSSQAYFTQQTYPWGFSYSFSEIGKSRNTVSSKSAITQSGFQTANLALPVPLGFQFAPRLSFVPLPILRKVNESSIVVPSPPSPNAEEPKEGEKSTTVSPTTTTATTTTNIPLIEATKSEDKIVLDTEDKSTTPKAGFFFTHLTSPLTFSYGFTTLGNSPLPIPQLPLFGFGFNSTETVANQNVNKKDDVKVDVSEKTDTTTSAATESTTEKSNEDTESSKSEPTSETKSESFSESTTQVATNNEEDPNLETETISPIKSENVDPLGKLKVQEESQPSNNEEITPATTTSTTTTTTAAEINTASPTVLTNTINDIDSGKTTTGKSSTILFKTGNDKSEFSYSVKDETTFDEKSHQEQRNGDSVKGKYSVVEPDGTLRIVSYIADEDGFKADVVRKESYAKPFPVLQNSITRAPGALQSLSTQNVLSYYYNGFHFPPPNPGVPRNFGYSYIVPMNLG